MFSGCLAGKPAPRGRLGDDASDGVGVDREDEVGGTPGIVTGHDGVAPLPDRGHEIRDDGFVSRRVGHRGTGGA